MRQLLDEILPVSVSTLGRMIRAQRFPAPIKVSHRNAWLRSDVQSWAERQLVEQGHDPW
jgi:predicted DNA-binding transcriptional regulator AlpA